ncbi:MAG: DoxX family protein [Flavipsychrobacter sp.]|nr:DoxX family protein [Flavipsychrobacter sp.]
MKYFLWALRIIIGVLFIFSGVVKANDPLGLTYKMDEIFEVWNMNFMTHYSEALSILMIAFEIICGFAMLVGNAFRAYVTLLLMLNVFFTFLTAYILYSGKVKECGCFGDCIPLSNTATFYKDVVLLIIAIILFVNRNKVRPVFKNYTVNFSLGTLAVLFAFGSQWYTLQHLPVHDCLAYRVGNNLWDKMQSEPGATAPVFQTTFVYEKDGVKKEFTTENYPWQDSTWKFVSSDSKLIKEGTGQPKIPHDFAFTDSDGTDQTEAILKAKGYVFLWFVRAPDKMPVTNMDNLRNLMNKAATLRIPFYLLSSAGYDVILPYRKQWNVMGVPMMTLDYTISKTAIRTNPGLMLMKDGVVQAKWSYLDYPKDMVLDNGKLEFK